MKTVAFALMPARRELWSGHKLESNILLTSLPVVLSGMLLAAVLNACGFVPLVSSVYERHTVTKLTFPGNYFEINGELVLECVILIN